MKRIVRWQDHQTKRLRRNHSRDCTDAPDGKVVGSGSVGSLAFTGSQIHLDREAVNMLAQLSAWYLQQLAGQIRDLLEPS